MENGIEQSDGLLSVTDLVQMFEDSEEATYESRQQAERDRDYYDNKQLTAEEIAALRKRGQPEIIVNRIKRKIDFLVGMEKQQRVDPRAFPRTPMHENDAESASQALRYVADNENFDAKRSSAWRNMLVEGACGFEVAAEPGYNGEMQVKLRRVSWDRLFYDPHSSEPDFSDAGYLGLVIWMDYADALTKYPDGKEALDATMQSVTHSQTYDDKPKYMLWADSKRKRVRICQIWIKRDEQWFFAEYTKGGILHAGPSPYYTDNGESDCGLIFQSAYVDRDNNRYGVVREMIGPQDEVNKRRSKALHLLNTSQTVYETGAVDDPDAMRKQAAKPDGSIEVNPGYFDKFRFETRTDLAASHLAMLQEAKGEIDLMGPNAAMQGDQIGGGKESASGKAIIASQQGGMIQMGDLLDNLRHLDIRVFRAIWARIRQFWTGPKWLRVTDDDRDMRWIVLNVPGQGSMVAELDCDIIIDEAPDSVTPALEQWQGIVELARSGVAIPPDVLIEAAPNLKNKDKLIERLQQPDPAQQMAQQVQFAQAQADIDETQASAEQKRASAFKDMAGTQIDAAQVLQNGENAEADREMAAAQPAANGVNGNAVKMPAANSNQPLDGEVMGQPPDANAMMIERLNAALDLLLQGQYQIAQGQQQLERIMMAPVVPVKDDAGRTVAAQRVMPEITVN